MKTRLTESFAVPLVFTVIALTILASVLTSHDPYADIIQYRGSVWPEYASTLSRKVGPLEYLGGMGLGRGGCDVYKTRNGEWWLVGPGRRFNQCTPSTSLDVSDRVIREAVVEMDSEL